MGIKKDKPTRQSLHQVVIPADRGEDGVPARPAFTDVELAERVSADQARVCAAHELVDCVTCRQTAAPPNKSKIPGGFAPNFPGNGWGHERTQGSETPYESPVVVKPTSSGRKESLDEEQKRKIKARQKYLYATCEPENLRLLHGYSRRQLAKCLTEPNFIPAVEAPDITFLMSDEPCLLNGQRMKKSYRKVKEDISAGKRKRSPTTIDEFLGCLPRIAKPVLSRGQVAFYQDLASNNVERKEINERVKQVFYGRKGFEDPNYLTEMENWIVKRAWDLKLLKMTAANRRNLLSDPDEQLETNHDAEIGAIKKGIINIGQVVKAKHGRPLYSFEGGKQYGPGQVGSEEVDAGENSKKFDARGIEEFDSGGDEFSGLVDDYSERGGDDIKRSD